MTSAPVAPWVRNMIMIVVCCVWGAFMLSALLRGQLPSAWVWAIPGATYGAIVTTSGGGRRIKVTVEDGDPGDAPDDHKAKGGAP